GRPAGGGRFGGRGTAVAGGGGRGRKRRDRRSVGQLERPGRQWRLGPPGRERGVGGGEGLSDPVPLVRRGWLVPHPQSVGGWGLQRRRGVGWAGLGRRPVLWRLQIIRLPGVRLPLGGWVASVPR